MEGPLPHGEVLRRPLLRRARGGRAALIRAAASTALAGLCAAPCPAQRGPQEVRIGAAQVDLPMRFRGSSPAVEVRANGQGPFLFLIDTGRAGLVHVGPRLARRLGLESLGQVGAVAGTAGGAGAMHLVELASLQMGGLEFRGVPALRGDLDPAAGAVPIDGVLAFDLFERLLLTLDFPNGRVRVEVGRLDESQAGILPLAISRGLPSVDLHLGDRRIAARLATGEDGGFLLPGRLAAELPLAAAPLTPGRATTPGGEPQVRTAELSGVLRLGPHPFPRPVVAFVEALPQARVGADVLRGFALTFDQRSRLLRLRRAPDPTPRRGGSPR